METSINSPCGENRARAHVHVPLIRLARVELDAGKSQSRELGCCSSFRAWPCFIISDSEMCLAPHRVTLVIFESPSLASPTLVEIRAGSRVSELDDIVESPNNTVA
jgi:hypothetical protein